MDDAVFPVSVETIDKHWDSRSVNHLDILHEILNKSISPAISNVYAINRNEVKELANQRDLVKIGALLNMMNFMFYRIEIIDMTCKITHIYRIVLEEIKHLQQIYFNQIHRLFMLPDSKGQK